MNRRRALIATGVGATAAGLGLFAALRWSPDENAGAQTLWKLPLQDLDGRPVSLADWRGRPLLLNFWATWCEPCREEMPLLAKAHRKYAAKNLEIVGIALDSAVKVRQFADMLKIPYPLVLGSLGAIDATRNWGNKAAGLPFTLALDTSGSIQNRHLGGISEAQLEQLIQAILPKT